MDLTTIIANLERTILIKSVHLETRKKYLHTLGGLERIGEKVSIEYLDINIGELNRILDDLKAVK